MEYVFIQNYAKRGQLAISTHVFDEIISVAMSRVKGAKLNKKANDKFLFFAFLAFFEMLPICNPLVFS